MRELEAAVLLLTVFLLPPFLLISGVIKKRPGRIILGAGSTGLLAWLVHEIMNMPSKGRLLRIAGRARIAPTRAGDGWGDDVTPQLETFTTFQRRILSEAWCHAGTLEHASVPAFGRLAEKLLALGAPADLIERCHCAALDEIRHARRCFALASAYAGRAIEPGEFPALLMRDSHKERETPEQYAHLVSSSLIDGALGERVASMVAAEASQHVVDPAVRETLLLIARDEQVHAELAWDTIAWCLQVGDEHALRGLADGRARLGAQRSPRLPPIPGVSEAWLSEQGLLAQDQLGNIAAQCIAEVETRADELLSPVSKRAIA